MQERMVISEIFIPKKKNKIDYLNDVEKYFLIKQNANS